MEAGRVLLDNAFIAESETVTYNGKKLLGITDALKKSIEIIEKDGHTIEWRELSSINHGADYKPLIEGTQANEIFGATGELSANGQDAIIHRMISEADQETADKALSQNSSSEALSVIYGSNRPITQEELLERYDYARVEVQSYGFSKKIKGVSINPCLSVRDRGIGANPDEAFDFINLLREDSPKKRTEIYHGSNCSGSLSCYTCLEGERVKIIVTAKARSVDGNGIGSIIVTKHTVSDTKCQKCVHVLFIDGEIPTFTIPDEGLDIGLVKPGPDQFYPDNFIEGTVVKLFDVKDANCDVKQLRNGLNQYLPINNIAITIYDSRRGMAYGHKALINNMYGNITRTELSKSSSELVYDVVTMTLDNHKVYAVVFTKDTTSSEEFRGLTSFGQIEFVHNGQSQAFLSRSEISSNLMLNGIIDKLLVVVDCNFSKIEASEIFNASRRGFQTGTAVDNFKNDLFKLIRSNKRLNEINEAYTKFDIDC